MRASRPDDWYWGHPWTEHIVGAGETLSAYKGVMKKQYKMSKKDLFPTPRPGQKETTKLEADVFSMDEMKNKLGFTI